MLRSLCALATVVVLTAFWGLLALVLTLFEPRGEWVLRLGRRWAGGICRVSGVGVVSLHASRVPLDRPVVLLSNHQSNFDMLAIILSMPRTFRVVAKRLLFHIPVFGWTLRAAGMIPIDRSRRASAFASLDRAAQTIREGQTVLFFPEGTRSRDGRLLPFKKGAFVIALRSGVPIVPVAIHGGLEVLPKGSMRIRPGRMTVVYGEEIPLEGYTLEMKDNLMERVAAALETGLEEARLQANARGR